MKVLVFAHTPPPHHGQSYMVQVLLENVPFAASPDKDSISFYHVNARLSDDMADIGSWRLGKIFHLLRYIVQAWKLRWQHSPEAFYYIPAPAKRSALYRDWLVLLLVAPLFKVRIYHWHSIGLGQRVEESRGKGLLRRLEAFITRRLYQRHELSVVLNEAGRRDVAVFLPRLIKIVANAVPDPCPDFNSTLLPQRQHRARERTHSGTRPQVFELLYLAHATRTKGLYDTIEAVAQANARLSTDARMIFLRLTVAGAFLNPEEEETFQKRIRQSDLALPGHAPDQRAIVYAGYVESPRKAQLLSNSDALCFASYYPNEAQPVAVIEALAYGLPVVLSRWRGLPEMVTPSLAHLTEPNDPGSLTRELIAILDENRFTEYRKSYLDRYSLPTFREAMRSALLSAR